MLTRLPPLLALLLVAACGRGAGDAGDATAADAARRPRDAASTDAAAPGPADALGRDVGVADAAQVADASLDAAVTPDAETAPDSAAKDASGALDAGPAPDSAAADASGRLDAGPAPDSAAPDAEPPCPVRTDPRPLAATPAPKSALHVVRAGAGFAAVWLEETEGAVEVHFLAADLDGAVRAAPRRLTAGGAGTSEPTAAWTGAGFLVAWNEAHGARALPLGPDGEPSGAPVLIGADLVRRGAVANGDGGLVAAANDRSAEDRIWLLGLAADGAVQRRASFRPWARPPWPELLGLAGGAAPHGLLLGHSGSATLELHTVDDHAVPVSAHGVCELGCDRPKAVIAAADVPGELAVLYQGLGELHLHRHRDGAPIGPPVTVAPALRGSDVALAWAGEWVIAFASPGARPRGVYLTTLGRDAAAAAPAGNATRGAVSPREPQLVIEGTRRCVVYLDAVDGADQLLWACADFACDEGPDVRGPEG